MRNKLINKELNRAYKELLSEDIITCDIETSRIVILSDQHRGVRDGADDFDICEFAYFNALRYYFENGFTLIILGDAEDLWECRHKPVLEAYQSILKLETKFFLNDRNRYYRIYGNHDDYWREAGFIDIDGTKIPVKEKMLLRFHDKNNTSLREFF